MFDMEMLNDALNMPLPLFSTGKGRGNRPSVPPRDYYRYQEKEGPSLPLPLLLLLPDSIVRAMFI